MLKQLLVRKDVGHKVADYHAFMEKPDYSLKSTERQRGKGTSERGVCQ